MNFCVIDLEATCWETTNVPDQNEIIEIGLVVCNEEATIVDTFQSFVRPKIHPILSSFCKNLTKIEQKWIDDADVLSTVAAQMKDWFNAKFEHPIDQIPWTSWGDFDRNCLMKDCVRHGIDYFMGKHCSSKTLYANHRRCRKMGVDSAIKRERLPFQGTHHRALDDALNITSIIKNAGMSNIITESAQIWPLCLP